MKKQDNKLFFGEVLKTFGVNGGLIVKLGPDAPDEVNIKESVFITIDGLPVPFYFKSVEGRGNYKLIVVFDDMETETDALELVGKKIYYNSHVNSRQEEAEDLSSFIGYMLVDVNEGELGKITDFFDYPGNPCFQIFYDDTEILIPVNEELIEGIDPDAQIILLNLPEGLIDLYIGG